MSDDGESQIPGTPQKHRRCIVSPQMIKEAQDYAEGTWRTSGDAREELAANRSKYDKLEKERNQYLAQVEGLERRIRDLTTQLAASKEDFYNRLHLKDEDIAALRSEINRMRIGFQDLMDVKIQLDVEIGAYRKLLEGEGGRLHITSSSSAFWGEQSTTGTPLRRGIKRKRYLESSEDIFETESSQHFKMKKQQQKDEMFKLVNEKVRDMKEKGEAGVVPVAEEGGDEATAAKTKPPPSTQLPDTPPSTPAPVAVDNRKKLALALEKAQAKAAEKVFEPGTLIVDRHCPVDSDVNGKKVYRILQPDVIRAKGVIVLYEVKDIYDFNPSLLARAVAAGLKGSSATSEGDVREHGDELEGTMTRFINAIIHEETKALITMKPIYIEREVPDVSMEHDRSTIVNAMPDPLRSAFILAVTKFDLFDDFDEALLVSTIKAAINSSRQLLKDLRNNLPPFAE